MNPCRTCGSDERYESGKCKACHKASSAKYLAANKEKALAATRSWKQSNEVVVKEYAKKYREANHERLMQQGRNWRINNPEKSIQAHKSWEARNPGARRAMNQNRRAKIRSAGGKLSKNIVQKLFALQKGRCPCCGEPLGDRYHLDHIVPIHLGGTNTDDNVQLLKQRCNNEKHAKHPVEFMQARGFLL